MCPCLRHPVMAQEEDATRSPEVWSHPESDDVLETDDPASDDVPPPPSYESFMAQSSSCAAQGAIPKITWPHRHIYPRHICLRLRECCPRK